MMLGLAYGSLSLARGALEQKRKCRCGLQCPLKAQVCCACAGGGFGGRSERDSDMGRGDRDRGDPRRGYGFGEGGYEDDRRGGSSGGFDDRRGGSRGFADTYGPDRGRPGGWAAHLWSTAALRPDHRLLSFLNCLLRLSNTADHAWRLLIACMLYLIGCGCRADNGCRNVDMHLPGWSASPCQCMSASRV